MAKVSSIFDGVLNSLVWVCAIILFIMTLLVGYEVVARYFFHKPLLWTMQACEYSLLWITFLGAAWALNRDKHVKIEILVSRLTPKSQTVLYVVTKVIGALICLVIVWQSGHTTWLDFERGILDARRAIYVPKAPFQSVITIGCALLLIEFIREIYGRLSRKRVPE